MRVQFDLRPAEYLERERKRHSFNFVRLLAVLLLLAFFASSGYYIVLAFLETQDLQSQIEITEGEIADLEVSRTALTAEIARLKEQEGQFRKTLEITPDPGGAERLGGTHGAGRWGKFHTIRLGRKGG